jgi:XRE family transcriptional regulator, regulator of sulfur utilization
MQQVLAQLAARLKRLRKERDISQEDFAHKAGLHRVGYGWLEQRKRTPNLATLVKIAAAFDISLSELLSGVGPKRKRSAKKQK